MSMMECVPNEYDKKGTNCVISVRKASTLVDAAFLNKIPRKKTFYVKYGPPASGKSSILNTVISKDGIRYENVVTVDVDNIIQSNPTYIQKRDRSSNAEYKQQLYWKYRGEADKISDQILDRALLYGYDIAWETTGSKVAWTIKEIKRIQKLGYVVTVVYPLVPIKTLIRRSQVREAEEGQTPADPEEIVRIAHFAAQNLKKIIQYVDNVYIYDNSGTMGTEYVLVEILNRWDYTTEHNLPEPALKQTINSNLCDKLNIFEKTLVDEILKITGSCQM
eukprot:gene25571-31255_t